MTDTRLLENTRIIEACWEKHRILKARVLDTIHHLGYDALLDLAKHMNAHGYNVKIHDLPGGR